MGMLALASILFNNHVAIFLGVAFFGFFANLQNASIYTIPMELPDISPRTGAVVFSLMLAGGNFGNFMGPLIVGYLVSLYVHLFLSWFLWPAFCFRKQVPK